MKAKAVGLWIAGLVISLILSPLSAYVTGPLLNLLIAVGLASPKVGNLNLLFLVILGFISVIAPLVGFALLRKRLSAFSYGLLVGVLVAGIPGYVLVVGVMMLPNY